MSLAQGPGLFEPIHGSAPDIAGLVGLLTNQVFSLLIKKKKKKFLVLNNQMSALIENLMIEYAG